ncbi:nuclease-related domain-containing DEAD/DEAH box helicase [Actinotalea sp. Marseille-Q4924]|uniref:nuclease-related domain-containing DEAD/DEAH box helicase n=1 Tax=Actinotalea sp. Marseille-Q4924 TaxID=2866571 RepID=UPI001CE3D75E|nr:NERD domain-containing protein [Actinotalea sp. Marseille-Q4924]
MPRLHPETPAFLDAGGDAERTVWDHLRDQLPDDAALFARVNLLHGSHEREIDLLVAWPGVGLAVVEVKGGHVTYRDGQWWQSGGADTHPIDPVRQAQGARHTLTTLLRERGLAAQHARAVHMVAFPHSRVPRDFATTEAPRAVVVDRDDLGSVAFCVKRAIEEHGAGHGVPDEADVDALVDLLAGGFEAQVELLSLAAQHEDRIDHLTADQAHVLDVLRHMNRLQVVGGAGSGKTFLALEQARRRARQGERVALLCYSRGLGRYLERVTQTWPRKERPAYVGLFHDLPLAWGAEPGADDDSDYWERRLPLRLAELADARVPEQLFDTVVVDEAQDFGELWWPSLLRCLRDPDRGGLFVFLDEAQRVFDRDGHAPVDLALVPLEENLRSTRQIAQVCGAFVDGVVKPRGPVGTPVRVVDVPAEDAIDVADVTVERLMDEGWNPGQIALLTTGHRHPAQTLAVDMVGHAEYWDRFLAEEDVFYGHVLGFKGLERTVVVLAVNGFREAERARSLLYTGMSRARLQLIVVGPRAEIERAGGEGVRRRLAEAEEWVVA